MRNFGTSQYHAEFLEEAIVAGGNQHPTVGRREGLIWCGGGRSRPLGSRYDTGGLIRGHQQRGPRDSRFEETGRNLGALTGFGAIDDRRENSAEEPQPRSHIDNRDDDAGGRRPGMTVDADDAGIGLTQRIVAGKRAHRTNFAEAADRAVDQPRIFLRHIIVAQAARLDTAGLHRMDENIGGARESPDDFAAAWMIEVDADTLFVAVVGKIGNGFAMPLRGETTRVVAGTRPFDLDHGGAKIAEQLRAIGPSDVLGEIDNGKAVERKRHA
jgi:hypothetical protein